MCDHGRVPTAYLLGGDNRRTLQAIAPDSIDAVVTDPPYGLGAEPDMAEVLQHWIRGDDWTASGGGFMGRTWDSFVPGPATWKEVFRVLKPGGHVVMFSGTRTWDVATLALRLAGFEIRDGLMWLYGSGFPKSMNVSMAIDKAGGVSPVDQAKILTRRRLDAGLSRSELAVKIGCTEHSVRNWEEGMVRAAGKSVEYIIPSEQYRLRLADLLGYSSDERLMIGVTVDRRGDGTTYGLGHSGMNSVGGPQTPLAQQWDGWGTALKPAWEPIVLARKPVIGTVAANVIAHGTGALNIDATRIAYQTVPGGSMAVNTHLREGVKGGNGGHIFGHEEHERTSVPSMLGRFPANVVLSHTPDCEQRGTKRVRGTSIPASRPQVATRRSGVHSAAGGHQTVGREQPVRGHSDDDGMEMVEDWVCVDDCPVKILDDMTGVSKSPLGMVRGQSRSSGIMGAPDGHHESETGYGDAGGASRFLYTSKTSRDERNRGMPNGVPNDHPTVKPVELMRWLVKLIAPPGGIVLDPFVGSGSTGVAACLEQHDFIGLDNDPHSIMISKHRIRWSLAEVVVAGPAETVDVPGSGPISLFD